MLNQHNLIVVIVLGLALFVSVSTSAATLPVGSEERTFFSNVERPQIKFVFRTTRPVISLDCGPLFR
jgi:hypothetical protein